MAMRKTGVEPRNIGNAAQTTPVSIRSSTGTPQSSRLQSQPVSSRLTTRSYTVSSTSSRPTISPSQPRRHLSTQPSARKELSSAPERILTAVPVERSKPASELQAKPVAASRMASYHAATEKKSDWEEVMRKLSTASMDESETLAQRVDMIRGMLEQTSEEEKRVMMTKVLSNIEETVKRLQSTVNLVKSLVWLVCCESIEVGQLKKNPSCRNRTSDP